MSDIEIQKVRFVRIKQLVGALICHPLVGRIIGFIFRDRIPSRGLSIDTSDNIAPWVKAYIFLGMYESAEVAFVARYVQPGLDVVELGSSIGVVSCHIAKQMKGNGRLVCLEANPRLVSKIRQNFDINGFLNSSIRIISSAISYDNNLSSMTSFFVGESNLDSSKTGNGTRIHVNRATLSSILADHNIGKYSLVMDIEGAEVEILQHDLCALENCEQIIAELHETQTNNQNVSIETIVRKIVNDAGFILRARRGPVCVFQKPHYVQVNNCES